MKNPFKKEESVQSTPEVKAEKKSGPSKIYREFLKTLSSSEREVAKKEPARIASTFKRFVENMDDVKLLELVK